jgi:drug/metabolite transporter (DMT)-like permease
MVSSLEKAGAVLVCLSGFVQILELAMYSAISSWGYPLFIMIGISCGIISLGLASYLFASQAQAPQYQQKKWLFLRGAFGTVEFLLVLLASRQGTPLGDIASLTSVNVVLAAILGRLLLHEPLGFLTAIAISFSLAGAILISQPVFLFGKPHDNGTAGIGHALAVVSGIFQACKAIAARKAASVSVEWHVLNSITAWTVTFIILPLTKVIRDNPIAARSNSPVQAIGIFCLLITDIIVYSLMACAGVKWCPAATSTTFSIASMMICGYLVQIILYDMAPQLLTVIGAILMLCSVLTMMCSRVVQHRTASGNQQEMVEVDGRSLGVDMDLIEDDIPSLSSFIAHEFGEVVTPSPKIRHRCKSEPLPEEIGLPAIVLVAAAQSSQ